MTREEALIRFPDIKLVSEETSSLITEKLENNWQNPEYAERCSQYWRSAEHAQKKSTELKRRWDENHDEMTSMVRTSMSNLSSDERQARAERMSSIVTECWQDSEYQERRHLAGQQQMLKNMSDPTYGYRRYPYHGISYRSSWEVMVAEFLEERSISFEYEKHKFPYVVDEVQRYYFPDFYLPSYELFIEVKPEEMINDITNTKLQAVMDAGHKIIYCTDPSSEYLTILLQSHDQVIGH